MIPSRWRRTEDTEANYHAVLQLTDQSVPVVLKRSRRKTLALYVSRDDGVEIRAPLNCSWKDLDQFLASKVSWLHRTLTEIAARPVRPPLTYTRGSSHRYLGKEIVLDLFVSPRKFVELKDNRLAIGVKDPVAQDSVRKVIQNWYRSEAQRLLPERVAICRQRFAEGWPPNTLSYRRMKSRWGSCSRNGDICLNTLLVRQPIEAIDLVITHELCHLRHFGHDRAFYDALRDAMPDWKARERLMSL